MCLGVPGKVTDVFQQDGIRMGTVDFGGITRSACLEYAPEVDLGSYVVIHVGFAISVVDEAEAARAYELLAEMGNLEDIDLPQTADGVRAEDYRPSGPAAPREHGGSGAQRASGRSRASVAPDETEGSASP